MGPKWGRFLEQRIQTVQFRRSKPMVTRTNGSSTNASAFHTRKVAGSIPAGTTRSEAIFSFR